MDLRRFHFITSHFDTHAKESELSNLDFFWAMVHEIKKQGLACTSSGYGQRNLPRKETVTVYAM